MAKALTRRGFLGRLSVATGAAITAMPAAVGHALQLEEAPELLEIEPLIGPMLQAVEITQAAKARALALYGEIKPEAPEELVLRWPDPFIRDFTEAERHLDGEFVGDAEAGHRFARNIVQSYHLERQMRDVDGRTTKGRRMRRLLPIAKQFEAEIATAREQAGWDEAVHANTVATRDMIRLADRALIVEARTMRGIEIKANAMLAGMKVGEDARFKPIQWGPALASAIIGLQVGRA